MVLSLSLSYTYLSIDNTAWADSVMGKPIIVGTYPSVSNNTVAGNPIRVGSSPVAIAYNSNNHNMYVTNEVDHTVSLINASKNTLPEVA